MKEKAPIDEFKEELIPLIEKFERKTHMKIYKINVHYPARIETPGKPTIVTDG